MRAAVSVYQRKAIILVVPQYRTIAGFCVEKEPVRVVPCDNWKAVGDAILQALTEFEEDLPIPDWETNVSPARIAARAKSEADFHRGLKGCSVEGDNDGLTIVSYENKGSRGGLVPLDGPDIKMMERDAVSIGNAVKEALERAR
jgi:hypothetical protein